MKNKPSPSFRGGFTLVEIVAVLAVIAAIIAVGVPAIAKVLQSGRIRNAEGTASVLKSAIAAYLTKPGSLGTLPVTESIMPTSPVLPPAQWTGPASLNTAAASQGATLDNVLLAEGVLERPLSLKMGAQNGLPPSTAIPSIWSPVTESFTNTTEPTANYSNASRAEVSTSDGSTNPGTTGNPDTACCFNLNGNSAIPPGNRVAYLIIKSVPVSDAFQLALDVDGPGLVQNTAAAPATVDQTLGSVVYQKDTGIGLVDVYYYLTNL